MDDLDLIKQKINIVDLISEYIPLKKSGINFKALCPFHQEKTPSFMVSPERGIWHCFGGCQKGGDIFKFVMEKEGVTFTEAVDVLAKKSGVTLKRRTSEQKDQKTRLYEANLKAAEFFHYLLVTHKLGKRALDYLHSRNLTDTTIKEFNLGYAPNSWESLTKFLLKKGFTLAEIIEAGLAVSSQRGGYDRFRGRVIFPLVDVKNQIIGFAGRVLDKSEPKYVNSPQTPIFDKSNFLFGLNLSKSEVRLKNQAILTEGEMDMISSFQAGVKNVVACKGTALTSGQIELVKRYTDTILLCFDMDLAGDAASRRGIEMADAAGLNIKVIHIEGGKDPADLVKKDPKMWLEAVEKAEPIYDYYLSSANLRFNSKTAEGRKRIAVELLPIWSKISDTVVREYYLQKLSALIAIPEEILRKEMSKPLLSFEKALSQTTTIQSPKSRRQLLEEYLIALLLKLPSQLNFVPNFPETIFQEEQYCSIYVLLVVYLDSISFQSKDFNINQFIKTLSPELVILADRLYLTEIDDKLTSTPEWQKEVDKVVFELKKALVKASLEKLSDDIKNAQAFGKIETLEVLNKRFRDLSVKLKNI